jgi:hypothetical protein
MEINNDIEKSNLPESNFIEKILDKYKSMQITDDLNSLEFLRNKKIIICGNAREGYIENKSNIVIDSYDVVVRVNCYQIIPSITGVKTTIHMVSTTNTIFIENNTDNLKNLYPEFNKANYALISNEKSFNTRLNTIVKQPLTIPRIIFNMSEIEKAINELTNYFFNKKGNRMTGCTTLIFFLLIRKKIPFHIETIGFSNHELVNNKQTYYWGERIIPDNKVNYHQNHVFELQPLLINYINELNNIEIQE